MGYKQIFEEALKLGRKQQLELAKDLIEVAKMTKQSELNLEHCKKRLTHYAEVMSNAINEEGVAVYDVDLILSRSRLRVLVDARYIITYMLRKDGFSTLTISRAMGISHCTVVYSEDTVNNMLSLPKSNPSLEHIYGRFTSELNKER